LEDGRFYRRTEFIPGKAALPAEFLRLLRRRRVSQWLQDSLTITYLNDQAGQQEIKVPQREPFRR